MEFLFVLFLLFIGARVVGALSNQGQGNALPPRAEAAPGEEEQVIRLGPLTIRVPPEARQAQLPAPPPAPDAWWDEAHGEEHAAEPVPDFEAAVYEPDSVEIAPYEPPVEARVTTRPLRPEAVSMELEVDRAAEHSRFHARIERAPEAERSRRPAAHETLGDLRGADALRRAVLAAEVLGPPRALRDLGE